MLRVSGGDFIDATGAVVRLVGLAETNILQNQVTGGDLQFANALFGTGGVNSGPNVGDQVYWTHTASGNNSADFNYLYDVLRSLRTELEKKYTAPFAPVLREGGHNYYGLNVLLSAYRNTTDTSKPTREKLRTCILTLLDAAACAGVYVILTMGGFSDSNWTQSLCRNMFDSTTTDYKDHTAMCAAVADWCYGHPAIAGLEILNEPDYAPMFTTVWGTINDETSFTKMCDWSNAKVNAVRSAQSSPGVPLSMALTPGNDTVIAWDQEMNYTSTTNSRIHRMFSACDFGNAHLYLDAEGKTIPNIDWSLTCGPTVFKQYGCWNMQKIPALNNIAARSGKPYFVGETGVLNSGGQQGIYEEAHMDATLRSYAHVSYAWMLRWWNADTARVTATTYPDRATCSAASGGGTTTAKPVRWTWVDAPTSTQVGQTYTYTAMFEVSADGTNYTEATNTGLIFTFTHTDGTVITRNCTTPLYGVSPAGTCSVTFSPTKGGTWTAVVNWDHNNTTYAWTPSPTVTITATDPSLPACSTGAYVQIAGGASIPVSWEWLSCPTTIMANTENIYRIKLLVNEAGEWKPKAGLNILYTFTAMGGGTNYAANCSTDDTGVCGVIFSPAEGGTWSLSARLDPSSGNYSSTPSESRDIVATAYAVTKTEMTISLSKTTPLVNEDVQVNALLTTELKTPLSGEKISFEFYRPDGTFGLYEAVTNTNGEASITVRCTQAGEHKVQAYFQSTAYYLGSMAEATLTAQTDSGGGTEWPVTPLAITITKSGSTITATRTNGTVVSSGTNARTVFQAAINALTSGRTTKERILVQTPGTYTIPAISTSDRSGLSVPGYTVIECAPGVIITSGDNQILTGGGTNIEIIGGEYVCGSTIASQTVQPMMFSNVTNLIIRDLKVRDAMYNNIQLNDARSCVVFNVESYHSWTLNPLKCGPPDAPNARQCNQNGWSGLLIAPSSTGECTNNIVEHCYFHDNGHGGVYFYNEPTWAGAMSGNVVRYCKVERCGTSGISISQRSTNGGVAHNNEIYDNILIDCGIDSQHPYINIGYHDTSGCTPTANCTGNKVHHNTIIDNALETYTPEGSTVQYGSYSGINIQGNNNEVYRNDIKGSGAAIDLICGTGNHIYENYVHDVYKHTQFMTTAILNVGCSSSVIENNVCYNLNPTSGTPSCVSGTGTTDTVRNNVMLTSPPAAGQYGAREDTGGGGGTTPTGNPVKYEWVTAPTSATLNADTTYTMHFQVSDDGGATYRNPGPTGLHFEFTPPDGSAAHVADCTTSSGVCSVIFRPDVLGAWSVSVRWDWNNTNFQHVWSTPLNITVVQSGGGGGGTVTYDLLVTTSGVVKNTSGTTVHTGTDTAEGIQWAINNCPDGGVVQLEAGTYSIARQILTSKCHVRGSTTKVTRNIWNGTTLSGSSMTVDWPASKLVGTFGDGSEGVASGSAQAIFRQADKDAAITISYLELDGGMSTTAANTRAIYCGIYVYRSTNVTIDHCYIHRFSKAGIYVTAASPPTGSTYNAIITNCEIADIGLWHASYPQRVWANGIALGGGGISGLSRCYIVNNVIHRCSMHAIDFEPGANTTVKDNYLACPYLYCDGDKNTDGSYKEKQPWVVGLLPYGGKATTGNIITHNQIETNNGWGVVPSGSTTTGNSITNNVIRYTRKCIEYSNSAPTGQDSNNDCAVWSSWKFTS